MQYELVGPVHYIADELVKLTYTNGSFAVVHVFKPSEDTLSITIQFTKLCRMNVQDVQEDAHPCTSDHNHALPAGATI